MSLRKFLLTLLFFWPTAANAGELTDADNLTAHDFEFKAIDGGRLALSQFAGKVILVVNTASRCGFTRQYADLQTIWQKYQAQGLVVLGVPSNDFGGQEPASNAKIKEFCAVNFDIDFPLTEKTVVSGDQAHPFYRWASDELGMLAKPRWNFHKYLIAPDGSIADWFASTTSPSSPKITNAIDQLLSKTL